ncbi:MAG: hypothetical protein WAM97_12000 [Acidimicrobiales bacterium]
MLAHQGGEGLVVLPTNYSILGDPDLLEEGLVHQTTFSNLYLEIGLVAAVQEVDGCMSCHLELLLGDNQ